MDIVHRKEVTAACGCTSCVNFKEPRFHVKYKNRLIYFCSRSCVTEFEEDPATFLNSNHFKIEFEMLDTIKERKRENLSNTEIKDIEQHRNQLNKDGLLTLIEK